MVRAIKACRDGIDPKGLEGKWISHVKGRGVFAVDSFQAGDFLLEYRGKLTERDPGDGRYTFEFDLNGNTYWLDATAEDGSLGRLINDDKKCANATTKAVLVDGRPRLFFFAISDIPAGREVTYSYNKGTPCPYPWRVKVPKYWYPLAGTKKTYLKTGRHIQISKDRYPHVPT
ncbi:N-lysine methyltransferase KMT5A-like [Ostrea edulis]|uniref:N-lysine methyltransferase KMT5A-like n=1 Tax=Ostrea edulis TaxID=37623 RepID=UPI0024AEC191|nr:N-lysine methyltransferase KMT5A-like [Ostrea edulis]